MKQENIVNALFPCFIMEVMDMIRFIEKIVMAACGVLIIETAHAMGYIRGAADAITAKNIEESKDHE